MSHLKNYNILGLTDNSSLGVLSNYHKSVMSFNDNYSRHVLRNGLMNERTPLNCTFTLIDLTRN